jgi:hypothetical protein
MQCVQKEVQPIKESDMREMAETDNHYVPHIMYMTDHELTPLKMEI